VKYEKMGMWKRKFKGKKIMTRKGDNTHHKQVKNFEGTTAKKQQIN
jgi:hypothetical protein